MAIKGAERPRHVAETAKESLPSLTLGQNYKEEIPSWQTDDLDTESDRRQTQRICQRGQIYLSLQSDSSVLERRILHQDRWLRFDAPNKVKS